jgi:hypothetical protein
MMTATQAPIPAELLTIVRANEAPWDDLAVFFGTTDYPNSSNRAIHGPPLHRRDPNA